MTPTPMIEEIKKSISDREIKFRGKRVRDDQRVYGYLSGPHSIEVKNTIGPDTVLVQRDTVGQYTGFCDKDGEEIYHGDVLSFVKLTTKDITKLSAPSLIRSTVIMSDGGFMVYDGEYMISLGGLLKYENDLKVIGNIFEDPDIELTP